MSTEFAIKIVERPAVKAAGLKVHTSLDKASVDCPKLWGENFAPNYMETFPCDGSGNSYGVSVMTSETEFDYWAVMPLGNGAKVPAGLEEITIPGGAYAECPVKSLQEMGEAYTYIYTAWSAAQKDYAVNFQAPCLELYTTDYLKNGSLTVYAPVVKK
jgi:predicted transcriptional regulator YdeE